VDPAPLPDITDYLFKFKSLAQYPGCFHFIEREKNLISLADLGITISDARNTIMQLTYSNYCGGPEEDRDRPGQTIWKFGCSLGGDDVYIKLSGNFSYNIAKCISFHKADGPLFYPYSC
jgi:hypothetical protein